MQMWSGDPGRARGQETSPGDDPNSCATQDLHIHNDDFHLLEDWGCLHFQKLPGNLVMIVAISGYTWRPIPAKQRQEVVQHRVKQDGHFLRKHVAWMAIFSGKSLEKLPIHQGLGGECI